MEVSLAHNPIDEFRSFQILQYRVNDRFKIYSQRRQRRGVFKGNLGILLVGDTKGFDQLESLPPLPPQNCKPYPQCKRHVWDHGELGDEKQLGFPSNGGVPYRRIVDQIWELMRGFSITVDRAPDSSKIPWNVSDFKELVSHLDSFKVANPTNNSLTKIQGDQRFFAVLRDQDFCNWLKPNLFNAPALRIVGGDDWHLRELCTLLFGDKEDFYNFLHYDLKTLSEHPEEGNEVWKGNALVGPLLLKTFKFIIDKYAKKSVHAAIDELFEGIWCKTPKSVLQGSSVEKLVSAIVELGSNLVHTINNILRPKMPKKDKNTTSKKLVIMVSGLHVFRKTPELGRLVYCLRELSESISQSDFECKILFTYEQDRILDVLLSDITCISDDERLGKSIYALDNTAWLELLVF